MSSIEAQLELERYMSERGAENFTKAQEDAEQNGRGADTTYARRLMREFMLPLIDALQDFLDKKQPGIRAKSRPLLAQCSPDKAMYMTMQALFNSFTMEAPLTNLALTIGRMVEDEVRFSRFQSQYSTYYDEIKRDFARKGTKDYRYQHRVLTHKANEKEDGWIEWAQTERIDIGYKLLDIVLQNTDLIEKRVDGDNRTTPGYAGKTRKTVVRLVPTESASKWIKENSELCKFMFPDKMPCIIPPDDWTSINQGGYYSPELRTTTPLIKTSSKRHKKFVQNSDLSLTIESVNALQAVPWEVNSEVLTVLKAVWAKNLHIGMPPSDPLTIPDSPVAGLDKKNLTAEQQERFTDWKHEAAEIHTREKERVSKSYQVSRIIRLANEYAKHPNFWYVWYADFRGRLYTTTAGFSPQGPDLAKGILRFSRSKPLGANGFYWLCVHGANRFGYDKVSYDARVQWVGDNREHFERAANDPLGNTDVWASADKPWQFLAFLFEYRDALALESIGRSVTEYRSKLPIGLDGSCNGLQNFSAMLRDERGGTSTNLVPQTVPADIYAEVARVCTAKVLAAADTGDAEARRWIAFCDAHGKGSIPRGMAKRPVMTLPYGATRQSCTKYIFESIVETDREFFTGNFAAACWLTPYLWSSIGDVVIAAKDAMGWLQKSATEISKINIPITWKAIDGFPIYQGSRITETVKIDTQLAGRFQVRVGKFTEDMDKQKQRLGVAPNFVHSCDAAHLRSTVRKAIKAGITDLALIHDDYGTHACDTDKLHELIREAFVEMYQHTNPLAEFRDRQESAGIILPPLPPTGALDISAVKDSLYFFG